MDWKPCIRALEAADVPLDEIASAMGVTTNAIRELLSDRTKSPRAAAAFRLMALLQKHGIEPPQPEARAVA
jgi:transcriptional regulator with XRE-family HTH domain